MVFAIRVLLCLGLLGASVGRPETISGRCYAGFKVNADQRLDVSFHGRSTVSQATCGSQCVFRVRACSEAASSGCKPATLKSVTGRAGHQSLVPAPVASPGCTSQATDVVLTPKGTRPKKQKVNIVAAATIGKKRKKEKDNLILVCEPSTANASCCTAPAGGRSFDIGDDSHIFALGGVMAETPQTETGTISLAKGTTTADGSADLSVACDSVLGFQAINGSYACLKIDAAGSSGKIYCNGGTPVDIDASGGHTMGNDPPHVQIGGTNARPGDAYIMANSRFIICPDDGADGGCIGTITSSSDCADPTKVDFSKAKIVLTGSVATTGQATSRIVNPNGPPNLSAPITETGQPFSCGSFSQTGSGGVLEMPVFLYDFPLVNADVTAVLQISE